MAALPRRFGPDVTDSIMRFAVGYPRDRLNDIMNSVTRTEKSCRYLPEDRVVKWKWPGHCIRMTFIAWFDGATYVHLRTLKIAHLQWSQRNKVDDLAFTCDACESVELQLQRTHL